MAWFGKGRPGDAVDPDDEDTGRIAAQLMADAVGRHVPDQPTAPASVPPPIHAVHTLDDQTSKEDEDLRSHRATLIELCLYALDRARSGGVVERLEQGLATVGVKALRPDGERFDPSVHEAGGTVSTSDSSLEGTVAETEVVGFSDGDKLLRAPIVIVYAKSEGV